MIKVGNKKVSDVYAGTKKVSKIYKGTNLVYESELVLNIYVEQYMTMPTSAVGVKVAITNITYTLSRPIEQNLRISSLLNNGNQNSATIPVGTTSIKTSVSRNWVDYSQGGIKSIITNYPGGIKTNISVQNSSITLNGVPTSIAPNGIYYYGTNGFLYPESSKNSLTAATIAGIAIVLGDSKFAIYNDSFPTSTISFGSAATGNYYTSQDNASLDFNGVDNTDKLLSVNSATNTPYYVCRNLYSCLGLPCYLGALGEYLTLFSYKNEIISMSTAGNLASLRTGISKSGTYHTSTQRTGSVNWRVIVSDSGTQGTSSTGSALMIPIAPLVVT